MTNIMITGANRGIGRALFDGYAARGDQVTGTCRGEAPEDGNWLSLDVSDANQFGTLCESYQPEVLDLLICNAGVYLDKGHSLADGYAPQLWADSFAVNVTGVFLSVQAMLPKLQLSKAPKIAIISSQMASSERAPGGSYIYRASKAAALNLGRNLAADLDGLGISVGIYHPGWVRTDMGGGAADISVDDARDGLMERFDALNLETTGEFLTYDGNVLPY